MATAHLSTTVNVCWETPRHAERDCDVEVDYTFDGDDLRITGTRFIGSVDGIGEYELDELVWEAVNEQADEAYSEWLSDRGDFLFEQARDRVAESYIPAGAA